MKINLNDIIQMQINLDQTIHQKRGVSYSEVIEHIKLALLVELAELANEVKCFKFWSSKERSPKDVLIEEYADGIHFISSIVIHYGVESIFDIPNDIQLMSKEELTNQFNKLFNMSKNLSNSSDIINWYQEYLVLGYGLGFNIEDIKKAYFEKNKVNYQRQENNY